MAKGALIYRAEIQLAHEERQAWLQQRLQLALHPSEPPTRMLARLLAWCLLADAGLQFTRGLSARDEPDLWRLDDSGWPQHWVEVGEPDPDRLRRALRQAGQVTVLNYTPAPSQWWQKHRGRLETLTGLHLYHLDARHLTPLAESLSRNFTWQITVSENSFDLVDHEDVLHSLVFSKLI